MSVVTILDYGAGNVCSLRNAVHKLGYETKDVQSVADIADAQVLIFPGVGAFGHAMEVLHERGYVEALKAYITADRPFFGICIGFQALFATSEEAPGSVGLGLIPGSVERFDEPTAAVPHMGWNEIRSVGKPSVLIDGAAGGRLYFVHSFCARPTSANQEWVLCQTDYGQGSFISAIQKGRVCATQFHPEKSGEAGLNLIGAFLKSSFASPSAELCMNASAAAASSTLTKLARRVIACLDVRSNENGDLVVTKGDQYDVKERSDGKSEVRNLGKPVALAQRYYDEGADEISFLNITSFRENVVADLPMLEVLLTASKGIFVPVTIGGGIRDTDTYTALDVADAYFRAGADKVSIGSDAVYAAERYFADNNCASGDSCIETISRKYGRQAVVISVDPRRVYVSSPEDTPHRTILLEQSDGSRSQPGPEGQKWCWYACTVKGGRETRDIDAFELASACEALGAGEILLNSIDQDGQKAGFDIGLVNAMKEAVSIPVIASSGAGCADHFTEVFTRTPVEAALAAGMFHRREVPISEVKKAMAEGGLPTRGVAQPAAATSAGEYLVKVLQAASTQDTPTYLTNAVARRNATEQSTSEHLEDCTTDELLQITVEVQPSAPEQQGTTQQTKAEGQAEPRQPTMLEILQAEANAEALNKKSQAPSTSGAGVASGTVVSEQDGQTTRWICTDNFHEEQGDADLTDALSKVRANVSVDSEHADDENMDSEYTDEEDMDSEHAAEDNELYHQSSFGSSWTAASVYTAAAVAEPEKPKSPKTAPTTALHIPAVMSRQRTQYGRGSELRGVDQRHPYSRFSASETKCPTISVPRDYNQDDVAPTPITSEKLFKSWMI